MRVRLRTLLAVYAALFMNAAAVADEAVYQSSGEARSVDEILLSLPGGRDAGTVVPLSMRPLIFSKFHIPGRMPGAECPVSQNVLRQACLSATESYAGGLPGADSDSVFTDIMRRYMLSNPGRAEYLAWTLPDPPSLKKVKDNPSAFLISDTSGGMADTPAPMPFDDIRRTNWLHTLDGGLQFSQAYLSPNWYQGGINNLTLIINFLWNVKLNEVYHPKLLLESNLSYKLGMYSTPQDTYHKYSISEDLFQYNFKFGVRARDKWFYSVTAQLKTQFLNNYGENSQERKAAFLSPGELNLGLGMTYSQSLRKNTLKINVSIAPASYNLKTCIDTQVNPTQFSIPMGKKYVNQIGSSAEFTMDWAMASNISWKSRLFIFTDYGDFQGDWENTMNFSINKFLSTQLYLHLRYDTASEASKSHWRHWMFKEILSFGFRYVFSTK